MRAACVSTVRRRRAARLGGALAALLAHLAAFGRASATEGGRDTAAEMARAVVEAGQRARLPRLVRDPRLDAAAATILRLSPASGAAANEAVSAALLAHGVIEPVHRLLLVGFSPAAPEEMLAGLPAQLNALVGSGQWRRFGLAVVDGAPGEQRALVVVLESFVALTPPPQGARRDSEVPLAGELLAPYGRPRLVVTTPQGQAMEPKLSVEGRRFSAALRCGERGRYQVEILGESGHGPTVLANFPWYCDEAPPALPSQPVPRTGSAAAASWSDARAAETEVLALLNEERRRAGLPKVVSDDRLVAAARAYSDEMAAYRFVAHVSPRSGTPSDRVRRAGVPAVLVTENLAQAGSPREAHASLVGSPGHRANLLDPRVQRVGIGAREVVGVGGARQLLVTQLFITPPRPFDPRQAPAEVVQRLQALRQAAHLPELVVDEVLNQAAQQTAQALARGEVDDEHADARLAASSAAQSRRYGALRLVLTRVGAPEQVEGGRALSEPTLRHVGVAVVPSATAPAAGALPELVVVVVLAQPHG
ncbi:MAG: CAP domain-containing protein [Polyangia bacterium]